MKQTINNNEEILFNATEYKEFNDTNKSKNIEYKKVTFKEYTVETEYLFPLSTNDFIPKNHIARLIHEIVERIDIKEIEDTYKGGGSSAYHPRMLLKVWLLGFVYGIYTSRKLEQAIRENVAFIWISGQNQPDFRTLNNFRLRLKGEIKEIFRDIVIIGMKLGLIKGENIFVDHTKMEANANKYKIVWKKQVERQLNKIEVELDELFKYIDKLNIEEDNKYGERGLSKETEINKEKIEKVVSLINEKSKKKEMSREEVREIKKKIKRIKELKEKEEEYKKKKEKLKGRNSYSKTDEDATAMMQKDGVSVKPSYNEGIAVENGFVVNYEISQNAADNVSFKEIIEGSIENLDKKPEAVHGDGSYGDEENMRYLKEIGIGNYLKYGNYRNENKFKWHREKVRKEDFIYDSDRDCYICVRGKELNFKYEYEKTKSNGYKEKIRVYEANEVDCCNCPLKEYCTESKSRSIHISREYEKLKEEARNNLNSEKGIKLIKERGYQVESIFGCRKMNGRYRRYILRGLEKVYIESGLYYISHNIKKIYEYIMKILIKYNTNLLEYKPIMIKN